MRRTASVLAIAATITLLGAGVATAVPPTDSSVSAAAGGAGDAAITRGGTMVFTGPAGVFTDGEQIDITVTSVDGASFSGGTTTARPDGSFAASVTIAEQGSFTLTATGRTSERTISTMVNVDADNAVTGATISTAGTRTSAAAGPADTDTDPAMLLWGASGIGALSLGAGSIVVARRRSA